ncbi:30S ribosomal protein S14 [Candidatus Micrarchaeota archaeon CG10_big_fil_rev_8_21_14_0_10_59_7]|nr:MAG: 30S ribosomal protein S14 [Candidatus Micrarchaeota archaeon CG10_big_fil_rev_8_21_14_0_10_59_7]
MQKEETRFRKRGKRRCRMCGNARGLIRKYGMYVCRKCFRENAEKIGFRKYG